MNDPSEDQLLCELEPIWNRIDELWESQRTHPAFHGYVSADYPTVLRELVKLKKSASTFLEWGSGLGAVAMMASLVGFEAYGIEAEEELVGYARELAEDFDIEVEFAVGSFIPDEFDWDPASGANVTITQIDVPEGYSSLGLELRDFDVVYAYPWPDEHFLLHDVMKQFANPDATLLTYDAHEGIQYTMANPRR